MDYGIDDVSIMFTKHQSTMMRTFLKSTENTSLKFTTDDAIPHTLPTAEDIYVHVLPTPEKWYYTDDSLSSSAILTIICVFVLVVLVLYAGVRYNKITSWF